MKRPEKEPRGDIVVFTTPYTPVTHKLGVRREFKKLKKDLQHVLQVDVLGNVQAVVANPVDRCVFRDTYGKNFPVDTFPSS